MSGYPPYADPQYGRRAIKTDQTPRIPRAQVHNSAAQNVASATFYAPTLDVQDYDTHGMVSATATPYLTVRRAGVYLVRFTAVLLTSAAVPGIVSILQNGTAVVQEHHARSTNPNGAQTFVAQVPLALNRGDALGATIRQDTGGTLSLQANSAILTAVWLGNL